MSPDKPTFGSRHVLVHQVCQGLHADTVHCGIDVEYERSLVKNIGRVVLGETPGGFSGSGGWPFTRDNVCRTLPTTP